MSISSTIIHFDQNLKFEKYEGYTDFPISLRYVTVTCDVLKILINYFRVFARNYLFLFYQYGRIGK